MMGSNNGEDFDTIVKDHEKILRKIQEIKEFEKKYPKFDNSNIRPQEELIEVDEKLEEFIETLPKTVEQPKKRKEKIPKRYKKKQSIEQPLNPTVFHLRIQGEKLENLDIKKSPVKEKKKKLLSTNRSKKGNGVGIEGRETSYELSKIKGGLGRIRKAIPSRQKKSLEEKETND